MNEKSTSRTKRRAIRRLAEELEDILDAFGWYGISGPAPQAAQVREEVPGVRRLDDPLKSEGPGLGSAGGDESDDDEYGDDGRSDDDVDPWDIQTAIDRAISSLMKDDLISGLSDGKNAPSLSEVFAFLLGEGHDLTKQVEYFEELIAGYEDRVLRDDLKEAHSVLLDVSEELGTLTRRRAPG
jgi:hypothetical protein